MPTRCAWLVVLLAASPLRADETVTYPLIEGNRLAHLSVENGCRAAVQDGVLRLESGDGWLRSHHTYADFKLHVEWKALQAENYDAGIYIRALPGGKPFPKRGYQINLLQGKEGFINRVEGAQAREGLVKPAGEWNVFDIAVVGDSVTLDVNGKRAYKAQGIEIPRGHVGLQVEVPKGGRFEFRNLRLTEIGARSLFNEKDFTHWEGAGGPAEQCWAIEDGLLLCKKQRGPWLRTKDEFGDFNLRFEYRVAAGANSGVYVRVPKNGNHHRDNDKLPPAGFEIQILDDSAAKYRKLKPYQFCGSLYDIAGASSHVGRKPGEWNSLEINCLGQRVTVTHNGVNIVDVTPESHPLIKLRKLKGHLGLQNHGGGVWFKNLRIGPAVK